MEGGGRRCGEPSGVVMKKRNSSGCLIVKKKGDGLGGICSSSGSRQVYGSWLENKRSRMVMSDSGSSDELWFPPHRKTGHKTMHHYCNGLPGYDKVNVEDSLVGRKRERNGDSFVGKSSEEWKERNTNRLDELEDDESENEPMTMRMRQHFDDGGYDIGRKTYSVLAQCDTGGESGTATSRDLILEKRRKSYFDGRGTTGFADQCYRNGFKVSADESEPPVSLQRKKYIGDSDSDEPIRVQGKNGVLKVMVNKKNKMGGLLRKFTNMEARQTQYGSEIQNTGKIRVAIQSTTALRAENLAKLRPSVRIQSDESKTHASLAKKNKAQGQDSEDSDFSARLQKKNIKAHKPASMPSTGVENTLPEELPPPRIKEGKVKRGSGTEKQRLRERIRGMLLEAGWTIDYRPRRNRDYLDAVYINPTGTAYWSIIKAYDALLKQLNDGETEAKPGLKSSAFSLISDEILSQLTRKTKRKAEKDMGRQQPGGSDSEEKEIFARKLSASRNEIESEDGYVLKEKLSSSVRLGAMSMKNDIDNKAGLLGMESKSESHLHRWTEKLAAGSFSHRVDGSKSNKLGRTTLLVRHSTEVTNSESDAFVPFSGKRTVLAWLIDSGTVQLSQKVMYMNRRRTRAMLEGWIARDGIHCGCCSKILTVSKFEIHAGSKLRQPFQNIYLDSGISLLQCQIDAWNRQKDTGNIGFCALDVDGDDPNDDACGICGDGGDLICCDGCPSTFHQRCLNIEMFPLGDWHCPNCTCKFCRAVVGDTTQNEDASTCELLTCSMCEKKYHKSCMQDVDALLTDTTDPGITFCGKKCKELFERLQKYVGIKHELEAGFSWSLVHRAGTDSDSLAHGLPQTVEGNSKLSIALTVMDECFLPIIDRRSGMNLICNVLYNCGSNFNRLNFGGFYTAILERGDEIISSASIRFHGNRLAEMPFIGTRHVYRRQGMCRRLFSAIESALHYLEVELLVIPATAEFRYAWMDKFGFHPLDDSLKREMRSMNLLVFPGIAMLQKELSGQRYVDGDSAADTDTEIRMERSTLPEADCPGGQAHLQLRNEGLDSAIKKSEVTGLEPRSRERRQTTSWLEGKPVSDYAVNCPTRSCEDEDACTGVNSASEDVQAPKRIDRNLGSTSDSRCPEMQETEDRTSTAPLDPGKNVHPCEEADSGCATSSHSPRRDKSPVSPSQRNLEITFLEHIIRSPVEATSEYACGDVNGTLHHSGSGSGSADDAFFSVKAMNSSS